MRWSKNVLEERVAPDQIILGAMDTAFCPILAIAIHLVHPIHSGGMASVDDQSLFCVEKERIADLFKKITECDSFTQTIESKLGTHSIRKLPATYAQRNGCSRDDIDARGRWKSSCRMVDTYIDNSIPYPDAKVAAVLCIGGAVKYVVREGSNVSSDFILTHVCRNVAAIFPREVALVLGIALLWSYYDDTTCQLFPQSCVEEIKAKVAQL